jgi:EAL domain-containing protein (putative c-di-GMP-specific phosphodiesterase class I)
MSIEGTDALHEILAGRKLSALFQPIIHMQSGEIIGYEGLIRGPSDSPLHAPMNLFKVARAHDLTVEVEHLCRQVVLERFAELGCRASCFSTSARNACCCAMRAMAKPWNTSNTSASIRTASSSS